MVSLKNKNRVRKYITYLEERFRDAGIVAIGYFTIDSFMNYNDYINSFPYNSYEFMIIGFASTFGATLVRFIQDRYFSSK